MLLRRIIDHVRAQNWTAVGLDFIIVVVGVFMGIQVSNWNDARIEGENKERYLEELSKDLELALQEIDETVGHAQMRVEAGRYLFGNESELVRSPTFGRMANMFAVADAENADPTHHFPLIFAMTRVIDEHGAAYEELVATGNIGVLGDRALVRALSEYYSRYQEIQTGDLWNLDSSMEVKKLFQENGIAFAAPMPPEEFSTLLQSNPHLSAAVLDVTTLALWQINRTNILRKQTEDLMALLDEAR